MLYLSSLPIKPALPEVAQDILREVVNVLRLQLPLLARRQSQGQTGQGDRWEGKKGLGNVCEGRNRSVLGALPKNLCSKSSLMFLMRWGLSC